MIDERKRIIKRIDTKIEYHKKKLEEFEKLKQEMEK